MRTITIHQPEHLPWLGFFDKIAQADLFVVLDTVQFRKGYFQNRNRVRTRDSWRWITLPMRHPLTRPIREMTVDRERLGRTYTRILELEYRNAPWVDQIIPRVAAVVDDPLAGRLVDINVALLEIAFRILEVDTPWVLASDLDLPDVRGGSEVNLSICRALGAGRYLSGPFGRNYLDLERFARADVEVLFHEFRHPVYEQRADPFLPGMSVIDLLANHGPASAEVLRRDLPRWS